MQTSTIRITSTGRVMLQLNPRDNAREIGWFADGRKTFHCERIPQKHFFGNPISLGFNYQLFYEFFIELVVVHLPDGKELRTTPLHIREKGKIREWKKKGFEKQYIFPLSEFGMDKARETEKRFGEIINEKLIASLQQEEIFNEVEPIDASYLPFPKSNRHERGKEKR